MKKKWIVEEVEVFNKEHPDMVLLDIMLLKIAMLYMKSLGKTKKVVYADP